MYYKPEDYVNYDGPNLKPKDLSELQGLKLRRLNDTLYAIEQILVKEAIKLISLAEKRVNDSDDWVIDFEIDSFITFHLKEDDLSFDENSENVLVQLSQALTKYKKQSSLLADGLNHNEFTYFDGHVMKEEFHCWLYHCLYHHTNLGWRNILRVGAVDIDISITYQGNVIQRNSRALKNDKRF